MNKYTPATGSQLPDNQALFLVWSPPTLGSSRSRLLARELGIGSPTYIYSRIRRSKASAPLRYVILAVKTLLMLIQKHPKVVLVQSPPSFAVLVAAIYSKLTDGQYIVDAHSDAFQRRIWTRPTWLYRWIARGAAVTVVTDNYFREKIEAWGARALVMRDPVTQYPLEPYPLDGRFTVTLVNTFAGDEPLPAVLEAAAALPDIHFYVTGNLKNANGAADHPPANVQFTNFLPEKQFYGLLKASHAVMSLTTRDHTLQCGACEGLSLERPVITSDWPLLREYFCLGTVHVDNTPEGIRRGIEDLRQNYDRYRGEVVELRKMRYSEWKKRTAVLANLIAQPRG